MILLSLIFTFTLVSTAVVAKEKPITFTVYISPERMPLFEEFSALFTEKTGLTIELLSAPTGQMDKWEQVLTQVAGGVSPDLVGATSVEFVQYAAKGIIEPLNDYIKASNVPMQNIVPMLANALCWKDKQYLMPYGASGVNLYYNPNLFNEAGLKLPPKGGSSSWWNWDAFVTAAQKLTKRTSEGRVTQLGLAAPYWDSWITLPYTWGGNWIDPTLKHFTGNDPQTLASIQALQDLRWKHSVMGAGIDTFWNGRSAIAGLGSWALKQILENPNDLAFAPWFMVEPHPVRGAVNPMGIAMLSSSTNKEAAWKLIEFATTDTTGNLLFAKAFGAIPSYTRAHQPWLSELHRQRPDANITGLIEAITVNGATIDIRKVTTFNEIDRIMRLAVDQVLANIKSPRVAMEEVTPVIQDLINQGVQ